MGTLAELSFARPELLWFLPVALLVWIGLQGTQGRATRLAERLQSERLRGVGLPARVARPFLVGLAAAFALIAAAGPQLGFEEIRLRTSEGALVIVLDTSQSMLAEDVGFSRLAAARVLIEEILSRYSGRAGLVAFEGSAEVLSPLTTDTMAVVTLLQSLGAGELERAGSDFRLALSTAVGLIDRSQAESATILMVSDGESRGGDWRGSIDLLRDRGIAVSTVMVGRTDGELIRLEEGLLRDEFGNPVRTAASREPLESIAEATGGVFFENPFGGAAISAVARHVASDAGLSELDRTKRIPRNRYQLPLSLSLFFFLAGSFLNRGAE